MDLYPVNKRKSVTRIEFEQAGDHHDCGEIKRLQTWSLFGRGTCPSAQNFSWELEHEDDPPGVDQHHESTHTHKHTLV